MTNFTRETAIAALVDQDCARWGESEREASRTMHAKRTIGLAINELAARATVFAGEAWLGAHTDAKALKAAAKAALTSADRSELRKGG